MRENYISQKNLPYIIEGFLKKGGFHFHLCCTNTDNSIEAGPELHVLRAIDGLDPGQPGEKEADKHSLKTAS